MLFETQARLTPDAIAASHDEGSLSFAQLNAQSNRLAHHLIAQGIKPDTRIAICAERGLAMVVGLLAILKAGGAYVPLDPAYPGERLAHMLDDSAPAALLTQSHLQERLAPLLSGSRIPCLFLDAAEPPWGRCSESDPDSQALGLNEHHLAYVIYTSGSTGMPKGVMIEHASLVNHIAWQTTRFDFDRSDVFLQRTPLSFDASVWEIWTPLAIGARLHLAPARTAKDPALLAETISRNGITVAQFVPSLLQILIDQHPVQRPFNCKHLFCGGEALGAALAARARKLASVSLVNLYGPTETTIDALAWSCPMTGEIDRVPVGRPIANARAHILDAALQPVPVGVEGEIYVAGAGVARGYLNRPELDAERFLPDPFVSTPGGRMYKTGDLGRWLPDGNVEYLGRNDFQVKIRGFRIETGEIESALAAHTSVRACAVIAGTDQTGEARLLAYVVAAEPRPSVDALRKHLATRLPEFMVPAAFVFLPALPVTINGKLDRNALPAPARHRPDLANNYQAPTNDTERLICRLFEEQTEIERVGRLDNFFELGGSSLGVLRVLARLQEQTGHQLGAALFFNQPTPAAIAAAVDGATHGGIADKRAARRRTENSGSRNTDAIAIVGMSGRFPGAADVEAFWRNLRDGVDSITHFTDEQLDPSIPAALRNDPAYVKARNVIADADMFDAAFFGFSPREAEVMDPQQRLLLELCWDCLEQAGYVPDACPSPVGVFAGMYNGSYFQNHVSAHPEAMQRVGELAVMYGNEKDYIATRVANRLNLTGPAISVHTACSTSLVAVVQAATSLRAGQCDMALAGAASITCPTQSGYLYQEGAMLSPDGHTRSFDTDAKGTVFGDGAAVVLLKRLPDALADGDNVIAVIRGAALNNDGGEKASFTAPSVDGQAAVIAAALDDAGVSARDISYVEAHGTATPLGDPIEVEALTKAYRLHTDASGYCRIGSVKSNIGHLVTAAGVAGLIKTALALRHEELPATLHYRKPNPKIAFDRTPFIVNDRHSAWPRGAARRLAGISSFGVGGTNAHVIVEEAPPVPASDRLEGPHLLLLSARTATSLAGGMSRLADHLDAHPQLNLADVAYTLRAGRKAMSERMCVVAATAGQAVEILRAESNPLRAAGKLRESMPDVIFMFPGQASQYPAMGAALYQQEPVFRAAFDDCLAALDNVLDFDLKERLFSGDAAAVTATATAQPALFCIEYALARYWTSLGVKPAAMIGHSVGEFVAATLAGVFTLADALRLVAKRGQLMQALPPGAMLAVRLPAAELEPRLPADVSLAAENSPLMSVVAGPANAIDRLRRVLEEEGVSTRALQTSHAFHSTMMEPAVASFRAEVERCTLAAPCLPLYSTVTTRLLTEAEACNPDYWARHLRETVRFSPALQNLLQDTQGVLLELGPRATLATLVRQHAKPGVPAPISIPSLGDAAGNEIANLRLAAGRMWIEGVPLQLEVLDQRERKLRVPLPGYAFERRRHWLDARRATGVAAATTTVANAEIPLSHLVPVPPQPAALSIPQNIEPAMSSTQTHERIPELTARLRSLLEDTSGIDLSAAPASASFMELGLDSLALTQIAIQLKQAFKVDISFRQLMEHCPSLASLASYLDQRLPASTPPTVTAASAVSTPAALTAMLPVMPTQMASTQVGSASGTLIQQVIQQQMQIMAQQLALLQGASLAPAAAATDAAKPTTPATSVSPEPAPLATPAPESAAGEDTQAGPIKYDVKKAFGAIARIHGDTGDGLSERQRARLDAFMRRYVERTKRSKEYTEANRPHLADPRVVNGFRPALKEIIYQIVVDRSQGAKVWDLDGNEYVDAINGFGMSLFGWQPAFVVDAVKRQMEAGYEIGPLHPLAGEVAKLACEMTGHERAGLCNTGSEAVMGAMRIARTITGRNLIVLFSGSYHGIFDEVIVRGTKRLRPVPAAPGILPNTTENVIVLDYGTPEALEVIRSRADEIAAVLVEPVQSRRPDFQPVEFLRKLRTITQEIGAVFILDEVITGFRSAPGGIQELFGIRADICTYGKTVGGGFPIGIVAGKREYLDALDGGAWNYGDDSAPTVGVTYFAGTFVRHPLALAAAKASLEHLKREGPALQERLNSNTRQLADELNAFCREVGAPVEIRYFASLWKTFFTDEHPLQDLLFAMMRNRGIHIIDHFPCYLTTAHDQEAIARIKNAFKESIQELQESDFLPRRANAVSVNQFDATRPPVPGARLGKDPQGNPAWFVPDTKNAGKYLRFVA